MISANLATYVECSTILSVEDVYRLLEVAAVNAHNQRRAQKAAERRQARGG